MSLESRMNEFDKETEPLPLHGEELRQVLRKIVKSQPELSLAMAIELLPRAHGLTAGSFSTLFYEVKKIERKKMGLPPSRSAKAGGVRKPKKPAKKKTAPKKVVADLEPPKVTPPPIDNPGMSAGVIRVKGFEAIHVDDPDGPETWSVEIQVGKERMIELLLEAIG